MVRDKALREGELTVEMPKANDASLVFIGWGVYHIVQTMISAHTVTEAGLLAVLLGFQMAFIGLITDVMVRRDRWVR